MPKFYTSCVAAFVFPSPAEVLTILLSIDASVLSFPGHSLSSPCLKQPWPSPGWKTGRNPWMQHLNAWWATTEMKWCLQIHTSEWKSKRHGLSPCFASAERWDAFNTVKHSDHICLLAFWTNRNSNCRAQPLQDSLVCLGKVGKKAWPFWRDIAWIPLGPVIPFTWSHRTWLFSCSGASACLIV